MDKKRTLTLNSYIRYRMIILIIMFATFLILLGFMIAATFLLDEDFVLYLIYGLTLGLLGATIAFTIYFIVCFYRYVYKEAFLVSKKNFKTLVNFDKDFEYCKSNEFEEIRELNSLFKDLSRNLDGRTIISKALNEEALGLEYLNEEKTIISEQSLYDHIKDLILSKEAFRNGLLDISYDLSENEMSSNDDEYLIRSIRKYLPYSHLLIARKEKRNGYLVYIPNFDSLSQLKEELEALEKNISLIKKTPTGRVVENAYMSLVIYPYSSFDNILDDLRIAKRIKKPLHIYIPERKVEENKKMLISSLNMNNISRLLEDISSIDPSPNKHNVNIKLIFKALEDLCNYYGFSCTGFINYDRDRDGYYNSFSFSEKESYIFKPYSRLNKFFIQALTEVCDKDGSYYFSSRKHVNDKFARFLDEYRIKSGMFYTARVKGFPVGIIYFLNKSTELAFDAFMKENLIVASNLIGNYFKELETRRMSYLYEKRYSELIKVSGEYIYGIDKETMRIAYASDTLKLLSPNVKTGEFCYKALYGLTKPCSDCPLAKGKRVIKNIADQSLEAIVIMDNKDDTAHHILLKPSLDGRTHERYDDETMMATFYSFKESLDKQLTFKIPGHVLFLNIKNVYDVLESVGSTGFAQALRQFNEGLQLLYKGAFETYYYGKDTLAIILPKSSEDSVLSIAELIPDGKIPVIVKDKDIRLDIVYLCKAYNENDTLEKLIESFENAITLTKSLPVDEILFIDSNYKRSASKEGYLFEVLVKAFEEKTFKVLYQPIVRNSDRLIVGSEALLRIEDKETNLDIDIVNAISIAQKRGYSQNIANAMIEHIDGFIAKYGYTFFFTSGLQHISINVDYHFFMEENFAEKLSDVIAKNSLPKGFLTLEVGEEDVSMHKEEFKRIVPIIKDAGCSVLCDHYHGEKLSIDEVKDIGFDAIKFATELVEKINNEDNKNHIVDLWSNALKLGVNVSFVGVSNRLISEAIVNGDHDSYVQGKYFFKPMDEEGMLNALRERNMKEKEIDL